jgi:Family of unknown function (DUF6428)
MNAHASPLQSPVERASSLAGVLALLSGHDDKALVIDCAGQRVQAGYHVTEVKAGSFVTLDCGGNPDAWQETILQVEDIPAAEGNSFMKVGKFRGILAAVDRKVRLNADARLTLEVSRPDAAMRVFDVAEVAFEDGAAILRLGERPAICKPRHKAQQAAAAEAPTTACCAPAGTASGTACCA